MTRRRSLQGQLYRAARDPGNLQSATEGPTPHAELVIRRAVYRKTNGELRRLLRGLGL